MSILANIALCTGFLLLGWYATEGARIVIARGRGKVHRVRHFWQA